MVFVGRGNNATYHLEKERLVSGRREIAPIQDEKM
jgi:hypothetical protein